MPRSREAWALTIAAAVVVAGLAFLWVSTEQPTAPATVKETNAEIEAPRKVDETPPSAIEDLETGSGN